jgi:hypothetical protein
VQILALSLQLAGLCCPVATTKMPDCLAEPLQADPPSLTQAAVGVRFKVKKTFQLYRPAYMVIRITGTTRASSALVHAQGGPAHLLATVARTA